MMLSLALPPTPALIVKGAEEGCRVETKPSSNDGRDLLDDMIANSIPNVVEVHYINTSLVPLRLTNSSSIQP